MRQAPAQFPHRWLSALPIAFGLFSLAPLPSALAQDRIPVPIPTSVQAPTYRTLTVTGRGTQNIPTTLTQVRLGVEVQGKTAQEVQQEVARRSSAVVAVLRSRNVDKLETTGVNLNPVYSYQNNTQRLTGYQASTTVSFRVPTPQAGAILDDAVKAGATRIDGVNFVASDEAIAEAQKQALRAATRNAQEQAGAVLGSLNLTAKDVVSIQVNGAVATPPPIPLQVAEARTANFAKDSIPVIGGEQEVEARVTLQISY